MSSSANPKTLVIAYGNRDRQDDGAGWHILAQAANQLGLQAPELPGEWTESEDGCLRLLYLYQLLPELAEDLMEFAEVIFIDAHNSEELPGLLFEPVGPAWEHSAFTHHLSIGELLAINQTLYERFPASWMLSVRGYAFEFSQTLSPRTAALVNQAAALLCSHLHRETSPKPPKPHQEE
jgi:hydrogenase maturation protease